MTFLRHGGKIRERAATTLDSGGTRASCFLRELGSAKVGVWNMPHEILAETDVQSVCALLGLRICQNLQQQPSPETKILGAEIPSTSAMHEWNRHHDDACAWI